MAFLSPLAPDRPSALPPPLRTQELSLLRRDSPSLLNFSAAVLSSLTGEGDGVSSVLSMHGSVLGTAPGDGESAAAAAAAAAGGRLPRPPRVR